MCDRTHTYTIGTAGKGTRYIGTDEDEAVSALLALDPDFDPAEEGYAVAEHAEGDRTSYCRPESERLETEAVKARDYMETQWAAAHEAFHGEGPYALANQGF